MNQLTGKVAIVTGAGSGFGAAIVKRFVAEGASVVASDITLETVQAVAEKAGPTCAVFQADVRDAGQLVALVAQAEQLYGGLDIFVNNAGVANDFTDLAETSEADFDRIFSINTKGVYLGVKAAVPALRRRGGGVILNTGSVGAVAPRKGHVIYAASKNAVIAMTRGLVAELSPEIRVNCVLPSAGDTGFIRSVVEDRQRYQATFQAAVAALPLKRGCAPEDVAAAMTFLASDEAAYITGAVIPVDGGRSAVA